ncbi:zincin [Pleurotus eryngii]|uniref:Zincin n=1 Tax=Pleurotus eryngii TaxID=5323 RepID=A0A9P6AAC8_PLEER|nr:zincin [Pleurotus eryngii]
MRFLSLLLSALVGAFVLVSTLENTDDTLKLLNDPRGPLSTLPTDTFVITDAKGARPAFIGVRAKYIPDRAAALGDETVFTVFAPGQSVSITYDLSTTYLEARNLFHIIDSNSAITGLTATAKVHATKISGKLTIARPVLQKRASFIGCSDERQALFNISSYLDAHTSSTQQYTTWFGPFKSSNYNTVKARFNNMNNNTFSSFGIVTLCGAFWNALATGTDSKAGTIVHESSHFTVNGGTEDIVYAIMNADSHEYFAESNPALS